MTDEAELDEAYEESTKLLQALRLIAVASFQNDDDQLGSMVGHIADEHPDQLPGVLVLALIDLVAARECMRTLGRRVSEFTGASMDDEIRRAMPWPQPKENL